MKAKIIQEGQRYASKAEDKFIQGIDKVLTDCEDNIFGKDCKDGELRLRADQQFPVTIDMQRETIAELRIEEGSLIVRLMGGKEAYVTDMKEWEAVEIYRKLLLVLSEGKW